MKLPETISKSKQEEIEKKREKLQEVEWDKGDKAAMFIAALSVLLPPVLVMMFVIFLLMWFFMGR